jgi:hypothetical protein
MQDFKQQKERVRQLFNDMEKANASNIASVFAQHMDNDYLVYACYPFNQLTGLAAAMDNIWQPLFQSFSFLERREDIFMAGQNENSDEVWVMSMGHFMGLFDEDWLGMRATKKSTLLRYAEFHCVKDDKIIKSSFFVDLIGFMQQIGLQPLPVQTGANFICPGPKTHDGLLFSPQAPEESDYTLQIVNRMVDDLSALNISGNDDCPPELLSECWHDNMAWFGPGGIGSVHSILRYQQQHQFPFRKGLKDKVFNGHVCRFAEGNYACFFGWPNLTNTPTGGFLGLPGAKLRGDMRVVDIYRREGDKLAENWVIMDIPYWLKQQGLDILERTVSISNPN